MGINYVVGLSLWTHRGDSSLFLGDISMRRTLASFHCGSANCASFFLPPCFYNTLGGVIITLVLRAEYWHYSSSIACPRHWLKWVSWTLRAGLLGNQPGVGQFMFGSKLVVMGNCGQMDCYLHGKDNCQLNQLCNWLLNYRTLNCKWTCGNGFQWRTWSKLKKVNMYKDV